MALSDHKGKFALATSFAVMTASSTVYAQVSSDSLEGNVVTDEATVESTQATISAVQTGVRRSLKAARFFKLFSGPTGKKFGGPAMRDDTNVAFADSLFFGPKFDEVGERDAEGDLDGGMAAGDIASALEGFGTWMNVTGSTSQSTAAGTTSDTELAVLTGGIDHPVDDNFVLGVSVSLSLSRTDAEFNTTAVGLANLLANQDSFSFVPYVAYILNENIYFDALMGVSRGDTRIEQTVKATNAVVSTGRMRTTSQFAAVTANYIDVFGDNYGLLASASVNWAQTLNEDYTDDQGILRTNNDSIDAQFIAGAEIGRPLASGEHIPYVFGYLEHDLTPSPRGGANGETPTDSRMGLRLGAGVDTIFSENLVISAEAGALLLKEDYLEFGGSLNLRWDF